MSLIQVKKIYHLANFKFGKNENSEEMKVFVLRRHGRYIKEIRFIVYEQ